MKAETANGHSHAWVESAPDMQGTANEAHEMPHGARTSTVARLTPALATAADLHHALSISQQQVLTALQQIDTLQKRDKLLKQEVNQLGQAVAQARRFAHHDQLTGLPNRTLLLDRFNQATARAARQHKQVALLFLDLDGFKSINDILGHTAGDKLLQQVAARLIASIRTSDTACRYGGDEFVILLPELEHRESATVAAEKIRVHLGTPYLIGGTSIQVTASIGMAIYPTDGTEFGDLLQQSDAGMYCDKAGDPPPDSAFVLRP